MKEALAIDTEAPGSKVFLVGHRYGHHSRHSGYDGFSRYLRATPLQPPVSFRFIKWKKHRTLGWQIDQAIGSMVGRKYYAVGLLLSELATIPMPFCTAGRSIIFSSEIRAEPNWLVQRSQCGLSRERTSRSRGGDGLFGLAKHWARSRTVHEPCRGNRRSSRH